MGLRRPGRSASNATAITAVNSGMVADNIADSPGDKRSIASTKNALDTVVIDSEIHQTASHCWRVFGNRSPRAKATSKRKGAPTVARRAARAKGDV